MLNLLSNLLSAAIGWLFRSKQQKEDENELLRDYMEIDSRTNQLSRGDVLKQLRKR